MKGDTQIWESAVKTLRAGGLAVLLVVSDSSGSSPGRKGFKLLVTEDDLVGSIGGGVMEVSLVDRARTMLKADVLHPRSQLISLVHRPNVPESSGMICSGSQSVIICPLDASDLKTVESICAEIESGDEPQILIDVNGLTVSTGRGTPPNRKSQIANRKSTGGDPNNPKSQIANRKSDEDPFHYVETLGRKPRLYIVGGGHCALALSELMSKLGFRIELFDDRADLNTVEKNSFADSKTIVGSYESIADHIPEGEDTYVVVMTLGYAFDEIVIRRLFDMDFKYFGVLGSKAKMKTLLNSLRKEGFDESRLSRIRTPIGVPINSRTPEEIAVSIAAEIILVKNSN